VDTLRWLVEHGCPYEAHTLWLVAADEGHISILDYLQQIGVNASPVVLRLLLLTAGASNHLAVAQLLRAQGAPWPHVLSAPVASVDGEWKQWEGAVLEWARAEGCTSPLQ
jgi:hypothetical protein